MPPPLAPGTLAAMIPGPVLAVKTAHAQQLMQKTSYPMTNNQAQELIA
jgi:hypothetical protein